MCELLSPDAIPERIHARLLPFALVTPVEACDWRPRTSWLYNAVTALSTEFRGRI